MVSNSGSSKTHLPSITSTNLVNFKDGLLCGSQELSKLPPPQVLKALPVSFPSTYTFGN